FPNRLKLYASPSVIPADGKTHKVLTVELRDSLDKAPAIAQEDIIITLSSTNPNIGTVEPTIILPRGESFVKTPFYVKDIAGETNVTAHAHGFIGSSIKIRTILYPVSLKISVNATKVGLIYQSKRTSIVLLNLTAESMNQPISNANVIWSSNTTGIFDEQRVTDRSGKAYAYFLPPIKGKASITATLIKPGFTRANITANLDFWNPPLVIDFIKLVKETTVGSTSEIIVRVTGEGKPIKDASLIWEVKNGTLMNISNTTDVEGRGLAIFSSHIDGKSSITVRAVKDRFSNATNSITIIVKPRSMNLQLQVGKSVIGPNEEVRITAIVTSDGMPVDRATLSWVASMGTLSTRTSITDNNGIAHTTFIPKFEAIKFS
ncbi:MAG: Ig-like domain-containing protein, partial [Nitrososphaerota archaeon]|nr:Ig-like domain-containing protein [Nitrososphaerota archaeon]